MKSRPELLAGCDSLITEAFFILKEMNPIIQGKLLLLLGYYMPEIFKE